MQVQRSKPYPNIPVSEAVSRVEQIYKKLGNSSDYDKDTFAQGMGYKSASNGAFLRSVAALIHYGLVERAGGKYTLTALARKMLIPEKETDKAEAMFEAALTPQLFMGIYSEYRGGELPGLLKNILVTKFGILDGAKQKAETVFRKTMQDVGLLEGNRLLDKDAPQRDEHDETPAVDDNGANDSQAPVPDEISQATVPTTSFVKDFGGGRIAKLIIPSDLTPEERTNLETLLKNM